MNGRRERAVGVAVAGVLAWDLAALSPTAAVGLQPEPSLLGVAAVAAYVGRQLALLAVVAVTLGPTWAGSRLPGPLPRHTGRGSA